MSFENLFNDTADLLDRHYVAFRNEDLNSALFKISSNNELDEFQNFVINENEDVVIDMLSKHMELIE
ncbi:MAG: hypothetical protein ACOCRK_02395 [bacterium]